jgi:hypothetical protein
LAVRQHRPTNFKISIRVIREIRVKSLFPSGFWILNSLFCRIMFETVKSEIATAAGKLTHLRRFL